MLRAFAIGAVIAFATTAAAEPKMLKGPYLQDLAPASITVMWQLDEAKPAKLTVDGPGGERVLQVDPARIAEAKVENLTPSSRYRYKVVRESTADHADAPKRLDGEIIVGNTASQ